ncbi:MAG: hypothetical protein QOD57_1187 [Actinomycetota bacterium]|jgi:hypothetical protein|nr:hypothetical protein [Actinomycetota bacterium]MDQ1497105.1 hypothetical protein [Actinomycetota bacterium]MDQ1503460.1 hypothetical protein [Actinomycetota bacterium]
MRRMMVGLATGLLSVTVWAGAAGASPVATSAAGSAPQATTARVAMPFHGPDYRAPGGHRGDERRPVGRREPRDGHFRGGDFRHGR